VIWVGGGRGFYVGKAEGRVDASAGSAWRFEKGERRR